MTHQTARATQRYGPMDNRQNEITPDNCEQAFRGHLANAGLELAELTLGAGLETFVAFYQSHPTDTEELDLQADLLVLQWGQYDRSCTSETFQVNLTRQIVINDSCDDDEIYRLSLTFHYAPDTTAPPDANTKTNGTRSVWFKGEQGGEQEDLQCWSDGLRETATYQRFAKTTPLKVTLLWFEL